MIVSDQQQKVNLEKRLTAKSLEQMFVNSIQKGANCPPFVARAILDVAKSTFGIGQPNSNNSDRVKPGQMKVLGISLSEPPGKPLRECKLTEAIVTLDAGIEDQLTRLGDGENGVTALRRKRLLRITTEALEQNVVLTGEDIAYRILNCGVRTVSRDVKYFQKLGIQVPLRGQQKDIGPTLTHKTQIVNWYIKRMQPTEITRRTYHSLEAVERYILDFAKVSYLSYEYSKKLLPSEIAFIIGISERLVREYQNLYNQYNNRYYRERLKEIVSLSLNSSHIFENKKGGLVQ